MLRHGGEPRWDRTSRPPDPRVLKKYPLSSARQRVGHRGVPIVERAGKVLQKKQRIALAFPETAKGITLLGDVEKLRDCCDVARCHTQSPLFVELLQRSDPVLYMIGRCKFSALHRKHIDRHGFKALARRLRSKQLALRRSGRFTPHYDLVTRNQYILDSPFQIRNRCSH